MVNISRPIASLLSGNLSRSQTTFRHSNTWRNRLTLHNLLSNVSFSSTYHFFTNEKDFLFPHPSPHNCLISDDPHIGIMISWLITLQVDFLRFEGHFCPLLRSKHKIWIHHHTHQHWLNQSKGLSKLHDI